MSISGKRDSIAEGGAARAPRRTWIKPALAHMPARSAEEGLLPGADATLNS
jgi:hypothetical protein